jgi:glyoxylase-like metal-dependent hydrolase (beta-lactamase superfamily II)
MQTQLPGFIATLEERLKTNRSLMGDPLTEEERASYESDTRLAKRFLISLPRARTATPEIGVQDALTIYDGTRIIQLRYLGRGHTDGDLAVYLPQEEVAIAGDIVAAPIPFVGATQSYVTEWSQTLSRLLAAHPKIIIPGHGPILHDDAYPRLLMRLFESITEQVRAGIARHESLDDIRKHLDLVGFEGNFVNSSPVRKLIYQNNIIYAAVGAAYRELAPPK